ncbi:MAG TPA: hypothetical protein VEU29_08735 [Actinomycetota bacterium]|nr:hypothetical protein [Actinomycetota bacterium]
MLKRALVTATSRVLVVSGCLFTAVGAVDVGTAESFSSNLFGGILALVGFGLLATAFGLWRRRPWTGTAGVLSLTAAAALALYLSLNAWGEERAWGVLFAFVATGCALATIAVVAASPPRFDTISASMFSIACVVGAVFQFTYSESARVRVGSTLTMSTDLVRAGDGPLRAVAATVTAENPTGAKIQSLGSLYVVEGVRLCRRDRVGRGHDHFFEVFTDSSASPAFTPRVSEQDVVTIRAGKLFEDRTYFEPDEELVRRFSVPIPRGRFDFVRLRVTVAVANGDRLQLDEVVAGPAAVPAEPDGARGVEILYGVSEGSLVDRMTNGDRVVEVVWESGTDEVAPALWASAQLVGGPDAARDRSASYDISYTGSTTELPLGAAKAVRRRSVGQPARDSAQQRAALWPPPRFEGGLPDIETPPPLPDAPKVKGYYVSRPDADTTAPPTPTSAPGVTRPTPPTASPTIASPVVSNTGHAKPQGKTRVIRRCGGTP